MRPRRLTLAGVTVEVETEHDAFARYLAAQFPGGGEARGAPDIAVHVRWSEGPRPTLTPDAVFPGWPADTRVHRHVWTAPGRLLCLQSDDAPEIAIASAPGTPRRFELRFHFTLGAAGWREAAKRALRWRRVPTLRRSRLSTLTYYAVYYPVWWHLEAAGAAHPLHAAGVALGGRGLLLAGLPGSGKSTIATSLLAVDGVELLSDNVVLHDGAQIFGCFEPLLLDAATRAGLAAHLPLTPIGRQHQFARDAFHAPHRAGGVPLGAAIVLARGRETRLERMAPRECARLLAAINEAAKEVRRYHVLAAILGVLERDALGHVEARITDLDRLLAGVPCYWLTVREGAVAEATALLGELAGRAREAAS